MHFMLGRLVRSLMIIFAFVALQASVLRATSACAMWGHRPMAPASSSDSARHFASVPDRGSMSVMAADDAIAGPSRELDMTGMPDGTTPCEHDTAPERCSAMASCAAYVAAHSVPQAEPPAPATRVAPAILLAPKFASLPPELPPPRA